VRAVVQRVREASVLAGGRVSGVIGQGLLVYLGVERDDKEPDVAYMADKLRHLRVFGDQAARLNRDVWQSGGQVLVVSAFTVQADARRGRRPAFETAATADRAMVLYGMVCDAIAGLGVRVERGAFGEDMEVRSINDGPVCILLDSRRKF